MWEEEFLETVKIQSSFMRVEQILVSEEKFDFMDIVMGALKEDGVTVLFVEHDMEIVERYVSRVLAFYQGEIIADMPPKEALADKKVQEFVIGKEHHKKKK